MNESTKRNAMEQHGRLNKVEINGIPIREGESCRNIVMQVANLCNAKIKAEAIDVTHRLYGGGIIVAFKSGEARDNLYYARFGLKEKTMKDIGLTPPLNKDGNPMRGFIFITEGLTHETKSLAHETRQNCKELIIKVWTLKGKIKVKGDHHENPVVINCIEDA